MVMFGNCEFFSLFSALAGEGEGAASRLDKEAKVRKSWHKMFRRPLTAVGADDCAVMFSV
jgi:hypothetical protein